MKYSKYTLKNCQKCISFIIQTLDLLCTYMPEEIYQCMKVLAQFIILSRSHRLKCKNLILSIQVFYIIYCKHHIISIIIILSCIIF